MSQIVIRTVTNKSDMSRFIRFPWEIYRNTSEWVPPLLMDRRKLVDQRKNPFYKHADAEFYLAERDGKIVGRIGAIINHNHNKEHADHTGFFGFFECVNDQAVANALLARAEKYLRSRGMHAMRGPASPSVNDEYGLLIEGYEYPPVVLMPYNPAYYGVLLEGFGLTKARDLLAYLLSQETVMSDKLQRVTERVKERQGITIRTLDMKNFDAELEQVKAIYNTAWAANWGAVAMTDEEIEAMAADLKQIIVPEVVLFAEKDGKTVGFALSVPDINIPLRYNTNGYLLPGIARLLWHKKKINLVRIIALGVLPEYLSTGIAGVLFYETAARARPLGYDYGEASWVLEDNLQMVRAADMMNGKPYKKYRIYEKSL
jgi:GNAT superfamily N-acetyltransferase